MQLHELRILVTGAGSGMGRHFAKRLAEAGAAVVAADVQSDAIASLCDEAKSGQRIFPATLDVSDENSVVNTFAHFSDELGGLNGLVNNAGIFRDAFLVRPDRESGAIRKMSLTQWQQVIDVDLTGPFLCTREFAAQAVAKKVQPAVVVNISSIARHGNIGQSNYSAAKAGLVADTNVWARELAPHGIRVGAIAPGFVRTPILDGMKPEAREKLLKLVPLGRLGEAEDLWQAVRFVLECEYFTGRCIDVDGGLSVG